MSESKSIISIEFINDNFEHIYSLIKYQGFDRNEILKQLDMFKAKFGEKVTAELILACNLRGPVGGSKIKFSNGKFAAEMGIIKSSPGSQKLTCSSIAASTADIAAYFMKLVNVPKRIDHELPGWLQFPAAGSIKMPQNLRVLHQDFARKFSELLPGGNFRSEIYEQMKANAYYDVSLKLF
jgi:hypothetical protein